MQPLEGITVVSLEQAVAGPFASRQLADLGARVLKVERPGVGDFARHYDRTVRGGSSYFVWLNRGKESIELDLKDAEDRALLEAMVASADVLLQNLLPGAVERLGLDAATLRALPDVLAVVYGVEKVAAARAALASGLLSGLVTHAAFARALLDEA